MFEIYVSLVFLLGYLGFIGYRSEKWTKLKGLVSLNSDNWIITNLVAIKLVLQFIIVHMIDLFLCRIVDCRDSHEIEYKFKGETYKMLIEKVRGPKPLICITDGDNRVVTKFILPYMGPNHNWHGNRHITPKQLGYQSLVFYVDGDKYTYLSDEYIGIT